MPDHVHAVVYATGLASDLEAFVSRFKQATGFAYARRHCRRLWHVGYYERILRDDESTEAVARYVLENPIRAGLANAIGEYPFAGSDLYDTRSLLELWRD